MHNRFVPIPNFPKYLISEEGKVFSLHRNRFIWIRKRPDGYSSVTLRKNNQACQRLLHRLLLLTFVGPCPDGMEACHNDDDLQNNSLSNLRWDTHSANMKDRERNGSWAPFYGITHPMRKLCPLEVVFIREARKCEKISIKDLAQRFKVTEANIRRIVTRKTWKHI